MQKIPVVFICDKDFIIPTATAITSLIKTRKQNTKYIINIIFPEINQLDTQKLQKLSTKHAQIKIIEVREYFETIEAPHAHVSKAALLKFNIPDIFPQYDKILYLDGDIIVKKDLSNLYNEDISNYYAGVIKDMKAVKINKEPGSYFNSGVMLLNLKKIRENIPFEKFIETKKAQISNRYQDQDVLNILFKDNIKYLPGKYNFLTRYPKYFSQKEIREFYNQTDNDIVILHFATKFKPWKYKNVPYSKLWLKYFKKTPYNNTNLKLEDFTTQTQEKKETILEHIFSVRNDNRCHKIINLCGIKFKFKNKVKILENEIINLNKTLKQINHERNFINQRGINKDKIQYEINNFAKSGIDENSDIIISLTSYPKRMYDIHYTIYSLLNQTIKPKKIILWLSQEQFPNRESDLGENILNLRKFGLTIKFIEGDIKSYKKLIPALKEYPENIIITVDDDIYYENDCIEKLYNTYLETGSKYITANRCHLIKLQNNQISRYKNWEKNINREEASYLNFFTGAGAVLYPPNSLHNDILKEELFTTLAPNADDIWFWAMGVLKDTKIKIPQNSYKKLIYTNPIRELGLNDDGTLFTTNKTDNDTQMQNILKIYPQILEKLNEEYSNSLQL